MVESRFTRCSDRVVKIGLHTKGHSLVKVVASRTCDVFYKNLVLPAS